MTDPTTPPEGVPKVEPPDDIVERTLEKASEKIASVTVPSGPPVMNRMEAFAAVATLLVLIVTNLFIDFQTRSDTRQHRADFRAVCQMIVERTPPENVETIARQLAECLD